MQQPCSPGDLQKPSKNLVAVLVLKFKTQSRGLGVPLCHTLYPQFNGRIHIQTVTPKPILNFVSHLEFLVRCTFVLILLANRDGFLSCIPREICLE